MILRGGPVKKTTLYVSTNLKSNAEFCGKTFTPREQVETHDPNTEVIKLGTPLQKVSKL